MWIILSHLKTFNLISYCSVDNNSKIVNKALPIEEIVWGDKKIPGERSKPWQAMDSVHSIANVDNLFKTFHLDNQGLKQKMVK